MRGKAIAESHLAEKNIFFNTFTVPKYLTPQIIFFVKSYSKIQVYEVQILKITEKS